MICCLRLLLSGFAGSILVCWHFRYHLFLSTSCSIGHEIDSDTRRIEYLRICYQSFVLPALFSSQVRWTVLHDVQSPFAVAMRVCASDNFIFAVAMRVCASDNFIIAVAMRVCASDNFIFAVAIAVLRKWQFHFGKCDSRFAQKATLISQVADVFCSVFKPWFPIAKASLTPDRWRFTICELILDGETIVQMKM